MKTQLLYLDAHDDTASTLEKLRWVKADHVVLVWPSHGRVLHRRLDLVLLSREAERRAAQLGVLSHDPDVRASARGLALAIFDDLDAVSSQPWPPRRQSAAIPQTTPRTLPARPETPAVSPRRGWSDAQRALWMLVVIAALLGLSIVIGPAAVIELSPVERDEVITLPVSFGDEATASDVIRLPIRTLRVNADAEVQTRTTGTVLRGTHSAEGWATFINRGEDDVILPEGTGVRTVRDNPQRFETIERALIAAGIGSEAIVPIRASRPGPEGNVAAGSIAAIEGTLGLDLTVTNREATAGGEAGSFPGVAQQDLRGIQASLERQLLQAANASLQQLLADGEALVPDSVAVAGDLTSDISPGLGEPSEVMTGAMAARVSGQAFDVSRLSQEAESALAAATDAGRQIVDGSVRVELIPVGAPSNRSYRARIRGRSRPEVDFGTLARIAAGRTPAEAGAILADHVELDQPARFRLWPGWWPRLPLLPLRIQPTWTRSTP